MEHNTGTLHNSLNNVTIIYIYIFIILESVSCFSEFASFGRMIGMLNHGQNRHICHG
jgi:hypothetical protein